MSNPKLTFDTLFYKVCQSPKTVVEKTVNPIHKHSTINISYTNISDKKIAIITIAKAIFYLINLSQNQIGYI